MSAPVPPAVIGKVTGLLGWEPISWIKIEGGYTPAARFVVRNGFRSAFVKLATTAVTAAHMYREITAYAALTGPFRPRLYGAHDEAEQPFLVIEDLSKATWPPPWPDAHVCAVLQSMAQLHSAATALRPYAEVHGSTEPGWRAVARERTPFLTLGLATEGWLAHSLQVSSPPKPPARPKVTQPPLGSAERQHLFRRRASDLRRLGRSLPLQPKARPWLLVAKFGARGRPSTRSDSAGRTGNRRVGLRVLCRPSRAAPGARCPVRPPGATGASGRELAVGLPRPRP